MKCRCWNCDQTVSLNLLYGIQHFAGLDIIINKIVAQESSGVQSQVISGIVISKRLKSMFQPPRLIVSLTLS